MMRNILFGASAAVLAIMAFSATEANARFSPQAVEAPALIEHASCGASAWCARTALWSIVQRAAVDLVRVAAVAKSCASVWSGRTEMSFSAPAACAADRVERARLTRR